MMFNVEITMYTTELWRGCRKFYKEIEANDEEQACDFARQMLEGFIAECVTIDIKVISE